MYTFVYIYVYLYIYIYVNISRYIHVYIYIYIHTHKHTYVRVVQQSARAQEGDQVIEINKLKYARKKIKSRITTIRYVRNISPERIHSSKTGLGKKTCAHTYTHPCKQNIEICVIHVDCHLNTCVDANV